MNSLKFFLEKHGIDGQAVNRVKRTAFLVGLFGSAEPGLYAFTGRALGAAYRNLFRGVGGLNFDDFIRLVNPTLDLYIRRSGRFNVPEYDLPRPGMKPLLRTRVTASHPLFVAASAESDHEEFGSGAGTASPGAPADPRRETFRRLVSDLKDWNAIRTRHHELIDLPVEAPDSCAADGGLPSYAVGSPLPGGFAEKFVNFLYADASTLFGTDCLDWGEPLWAPLRKDGAEGRETLSAVVGAFREKLPGAANSQFNGVIIKGQPVPEVVEAVLSGRSARTEAARRQKAERNATLVEDYRKARAGFNAVSDRESWIVDRES